MGVAVGHNNPPIREYTPLQGKSDFAFQTKRIQCEPFQKVVSGTGKALHSRTVDITLLFTSFHIIFFIFTLLISIRIFFLLS